MFDDNGEKTAAKETKYANPNFFPLEKEWYGAGGSQNPDSLSVVISLSLGKKPSRGVPPRPQTLPLNNGLSSRNV
jgi:hypothetical protein